MLTLLAACCLLLVRERESCNIQLTLCTVIVVRNQPSGRRLNHTRVHAVQVHSR